MEHNFPQDLLEKSASDRKDYFDRIIINHPHFKSAYMEVLNAINNSKAQRIVIVTGPPGVGKTALINQVFTNIQSKYNREDLGQIPIVRTEAVATDSGSFDWDDHYRRTLIALEEPLIDYKIDYSTKNVKRTDNGVFCINPSARKKDLRLALENCYKNRRVKVCIIDEAQHLTKMASGRKFLDNLDCIKTTSNLSSTLHVLFGTNDLRSSMEINTQLGRRIIPISMKWYRNDKKEDIKVFKSILNQFQSHLPVLNAPNLIDNWQYFYSRSLGCIGILKLWLLESLSIAVDEGCDTITNNHFEKTALSPTQCEKIYEEMQNILKEEAEYNNNCNKLMNSLGFYLDKPQEEKSAKNSKPFERAPGRDPIGVGEILCTS